MYASDQDHLQHLATLPLHRLLVHLRILALARRHDRLLVRIDDAIDAVVRTSELEHRWTDHHLRLGKAIAHPARPQSEAGDWLPTTLPLLDDARDQHQRMVRRLLLAIDHHPARLAYLRALQRWGPPAQPRQTAVHRLHPPQPARA